MKRLKKQRNQFSEENGPQRWWRVVLFCLLMGIGGAVFRPVVVGAQEEATASNIEEKVKSLKEEVEDLVREAKGASSEAELEQKRAFCGVVEEIKKEEKILVLETRQGKRSVFYDQETVFVDINRQRMKTEEIKKGDYLVAMGDFNPLEPEKLIGKRIVKQEAPDLSQRQSLWGKITDVSEEEKVFSLLPAGQEKVVVEVLVSSKTIFKKKAAGEIVKGNFQELQKEARVIVVGQREKDSPRLQASLVYLVSSSSLTPTVTP